MPYCIPVIICFSFKIIYGFKSFASIYNKPCRQIWVSCYKILFAWRNILIAIYVIVIFLFKEISAIISRFIVHHSKACIIE